MAKKIFFALLLSFLMPTLAWAHQPRLASGVEMQTIDLPEVSKAYYGSLKGNPEYYQINAAKEFDFYINVLVPDLPDIGQDVSVQVFSVNSTNTPMISLDGQNFVWKKFHEEFANDDYFKGPEYKTKLPSGLYTIKVFSPDNEGKYVLAVGERENFSLAEIFRTLWLLPQLKSEFFGKAPIMFLYSIFGAGLLAFIGALVLIIAIIILIIKFVSKRKHKDNQTYGNSPDLS
ncbi:MAG: hypothetical protein WCX71_02325 [Candidatus Buchananbacteria bacterium]